MLVGIATGVGATGVPELRLDCRAMDVEPVEDVFHLAHAADTCGVPAETTTTHLHPNNRYTTSLHRTRQWAGHVGTWAMASLIRRALENVTCTVPTEVASSLPSCHTCSSWTPTTSVTFRMSSRSATTLTCHRHQWQHEVNNHTACHIQHSLQHVHLLTEVQNVAAH
jgi:hypothetical protein